MFSESTHVVGVDGKDIRPGLKTATPGRIVFNMRDCEGIDLDEEYEKEQMRKGLGLDQRKAKWKTIANKIFSSIGM